MNNLLNSIKKDLKNINFKISIINNKIKIITPFLYSDNDHIEIFIWEKNEQLFISDFGLTIEKFGNIDIKIIKQLIKFIGCLFFDKEKFSIYIKINKNKIKLEREIIDFCNNLQRLEILYYFYLNRNNLNF